MNPINFDLPLTKSNEGHWSDIPASGVSHVLMTNDVVTTHSRLEFLSKGKNDLSCESPKVYLNYVSCYVICLTMSNRDNI